MKVGIDAGRLGRGGLAILDALVEGLVGRTNVESVTVFGLVSLRRHSKLRVEPMFDAGRLNTMRWAIQGWAEAAQDFDRVLSFSGFAAAPNQTVFVHNALYYDAIADTLPIALRVRLQVLRELTHDAVLQANNVVVQSEMMRDHIRRAHGVEAHKIVTIPRPPDSDDIITGGQDARGPTTIAGGQDARGPITIAGGQDARGPGGRDARGPTTIAGGQDARGPITIAGGQDARGPGAAGQDASRPVNDLLWVGNEVPFKDFRTAIEAAQHLGRHLTLIGNTVPMPDGPGHSWLGDLERSQVFAHYRGAKMLVMTSRAESLGLPLIEAMQVGLPVVAPDLPYARELCAEAAEYFEPGNAKALVAAILRAKTRRDTLLDLGTKRASQLEAVLPFERLVDVILS